MRLHPSFPLVIAVAGIASLTAVAFAGPGDPVTNATGPRLDSPTLTVTEQSRTSVTLRVEAGPSGAPSGFTLVWMKRADYIARGGWGNPGQAGVFSSNFYGFPTYNVAPGTNSYALAANGQQVVEAGDLFDETGVLVSQANELESGTDYVFRAVASGDGVSQSSEFSATTEGSTTVVNNCTYTQGYWKTHSESWPVSSLTLGTVNYTKTQLLSIFNAPVAGNGLIALAHQLIAAKLNVAMGADDTSIASTILAADAQIGALVVPPIGSGYLSPSSTSSKTQTLDDFNNGVTGPGHCGAVPTHLKTWGEVKTTYR